MYPQLVVYLGLSAAAPPMIALVIWAAQRHMWRTIALLSLLALALGLANVLIMMIEYRALGIDAGFFYGNLGGVVGGANGPTPDATLTLYQTYELWRQALLNGSVLLATAAWIIGIYQTIQARRWRWLAAIVIGASLAGFAETFASNPWIVSIAPPFAGLLPAHPFAKVLLLVTLPHLSAAVTALYSLVVLRRAAANEPVPSAPARLSLAEALNAPPPDVPFEDVVFEVEELPR